MADLFDIRLWLYPGANPQDSPTDWEPYFADISSKIRHPGSDGGQTIRYSGGRQDEATQVDAGQMTLTLDNRDGRFSTDKIDGPYYGALDINTPIRLGTVTVLDTFTRTVSPGLGTINAALSQTWTANSAWSANGSAANVIISTANLAQVAIANNVNANDGEVTMSITPLATPTGTNGYGGGPILRRNLVNGDMVFTSLEFLPGGGISLRISRFLGGVSTTLDVVSPVPGAGTVVVGQPWLIRAQSDSNRMRVKAWPASGTEPDTWQVAVTEDDVVGAAVGIYVARYAGNTNSGAVSLMAIDNFQTITFEFTGTVMSWPMDWDITGTNSWASITAAGVLRRLQQGTNPVQSPLRRQLAATPDATGYWPLEDGAQASNFYSALRANSAAGFYNMTPAAENTLAGGGTSPTVAVNGGSATFVAAGPNNGTGFAGMFFIKLSALPAVKTRVARFRMTRGPIAIYDISIDATGVITEGLNSGGTVVTSAANLFTGVDFTQWTAMQLETDNTLSPGVTTWQTFWHHVGNNSYIYQSGTVSGTTNTNVGSLTISGDAGTGFAHVWLGRNTLPFVTGSFSLVSSGYAGELAADRFSRVCGEAGIPCIVRPGGSEKMGAQREGTTLAILRACVDADYGVMAERGAGLEFIPRSFRWNLAASMAPSVAAGQISGVPRPVRDDQRLRNKWTVARVGGGQGVYQDDASVNLNGTWEDSTTLSVYDDSVLVNHAGWRVNVGTQRGLRWPSIALNFARNPTLLAGWRSRAYGFRMTVATGRLQVTGNEPDLIVEGWQGELWPNGWTVDLNCTSAKIWRAAVADDTGILGRVDSENSVTSALINATTLSIPITTTTGALKWDNTAGLWSGGVDFNIGGERVTVTSITNGAGQAQTLNCTVRGVNGYAASHSAGTSVSLWNPAVVAL